MAKRSRKSSRAGRSAKAPQGPAAVQAREPTSHPRPTGSAERPAPGRGRAPLWPLWLLAAGLVIAFVGLVVARYVSDRRFLYGLILAGAGLGVGLTALVALRLGPRLFAMGVTGPVGAVLAAVSAGIRLLLIATRPAPTVGPPPVIMWREILLGVPFALAAAALALGAYAASRVIALPPGGLAPRAVKIELVAAIGGLAGALYTLGPLLRSVGLPLNHWTFLGLVGLGLAAFLVVTLLETLTGRRGRK